MIFYRYLFKNVKILSINERLVYSNLLDYSLKLSDVFFEDGIFQREHLMEYIDKNTNDVGWGNIPLLLPSLKELSRKLGIARNTLKKILNKFKGLRLIDGNTIKCNKELFDLGYLILPDGLGIKGQLLVFYTFLKYRSKSFGGTIDTWAIALEEYTGINKRVINKKGLVQRLSSNKLKIQ